ncbi:hypothetical protein BGW37DRAFT_517853 [Umbelopsis sp. PMI_123]|nr:hypothetical protein BGW37DRAFT_517853 [Umbelopsis sp. PMI_123]
MDSAPRNFDWQDKNTFIAEQQGPSLDGVENIQQTTQVEVESSIDDVNAHLIDSNKDRSDSKIDKHSHTRRFSDHRRRSRSDSRSPERDHHSHRRSDRRRRSSHGDDYHHSKRRNSLMSSTSSSSSHHRKSKKHHHHHHHRNRTHHSHPSHKHNEEVHSGNTPVRLSEYLANDDSSDSRDL